MECAQTIAWLAGLRLRWRSIIIASIVIAIATALVPAAFAEDEHEHRHRELGPGCAPERRAIAHRAGGVPVRVHEHERAPIPCVTPTSYRAGEASIVVTNEGTVLFQSVFPEAGLPIGLLRSVDRGATWEFIDPNGDPPRTGSNDMNMWVDRKSGRVFWSNDIELPVVHVQRVDYSDDDGMTWFPSSPLPMHFDHTQLFSGPPTRESRDSIQGPQNIVYAVVSGGFTCGFAPFGFCGTHLTKSLDSGLTWEPSVALPYPPECMAAGNNPIGGYGLNGVVGRDAIVYLPFTPCERPYVAISHDEGSTWQLSLVADTETIGWGELGLGMDKAGNLYAAWTDSADRLPYLAISRDRGQRWSTPLMIGAPGINEAALPQLVAGARGQVAVSYYGSKNAPLPFPPPCITDPPMGDLGFGYLGQPPSLGCPAYENETWDTYVTESFNALDRHPLFWSATLNDPANSTWYGFTPSGLRIPEPPPGVTDGFNDRWAIGPNSEATSGRADYFGMTIARDNTPWVGFVQACPFGLPFAGNPNCSQAVGGPNDGAFGLVGRLVRVGGEDERDDED